MGAEKRTNICVAGCGHWGKNLARNFDQLGQLHAICEVDPSRRMAAKDAYPNAKIYSALEDAVRDPEVDAVAIATPAVEHRSMAIAAMRAGKDVFVEKPLALEWREGLEMVEVSRQTGRILMVGHLLRYHPAILK